MIRPLRVGEVCGQCWHNPYGPSFSRSPCGLICRSPCVPRDPWRPSESSIATERLPAVFSRKSASWEEHPVTPQTGANGLSTGPAGRSLVHPPCLLQPLPGSLGPKDPAGSAFLRGASLQGLQCPFPPEDLRPHHSSTVGRFS